MTREEAIERLEFHKKVWMMVGGIDLCEVLDMAIAALREQPRWIPVEERLPTRADANPYESVLAIAKDDGFARSWIWDIVEHYPNEFTRWMPMPKKEDA